MFPLVANWIKELSEVFRKSIWEKFGLGFGLEIKTHCPGNDFWFHFPPVLADEIRLLLYYDFGNRWGKIWEINIHQEGKPNCR